MSAPDPPFGAQGFGEALYRAERERAPIAPLTASEPSLTIEQAYAIQHDFVGRRMAAEGSFIVGRKIGATSRAVQNMLDVHQPDFGQLLSSMMHADGALIDMPTLISPRAEGEIAFLLKDDLTGPGVAPAEVLRATEYVMPCFEIVDSRIRNWAVRIQDTVADNASSGAFVLGDTVVDPRRIDLSLVGMTIERNGEIVGTGAGAAALGHPLNAVAWLANTLGNLGVTLRAGEVVLSGALSGLVSIRPGDNLRLSLCGIGSARARFTGAICHDA